MVLLIHFDNCDTYTTVNPDNHDFMAELFNGKITDDEILRAVRDIHPNKASVGRLVANHLKYGITTLLHKIRIFT